MSSWQINTYIKVTYLPECIVVDLIRPYSSSNRFRYILKIVDYCSKWVVSPLRKASAKAVVDVFFDKFLPKYGTSKSVLMGPYFDSDIFKALCTKLEISLVFTVSYCPRSNMAE